MQLGHHCRYLRDIYQQELFILGPLDLLPCPVLRHRGPLAPHTSKWPKPSIAQLEVADTSCRYGEAYRESMVRRCPQRSDTCHDRHRQMPQRLLEDRSKSAMDAVSNVFAIDRAAIAIATSVNHWHALSGSNIVRQSFLTASRTMSSSPCQIRLL